ncbi:hypothetical protein MRB53_022324 [Persea americana]|uniref:Uncharacterized protein n=1 Tax=Persea americana TaxID=3435 RepID=A0ACC2L747_PERAE|nr:hypothetical protein MRB53_022324 [Persea americana]
MWLLGEEKRIQSLVKNTIDYFHGNSGKDEGLYLFVIVRDFMAMLEKVCKEVTDAAAAAMKLISFAFIRRGEAPHLQLPS